MNKTNVCEFLKKNNFVPSKKMGQNFLINEAINKKIVDICNIDKNTNVIEIGPGLGAITKNILKYTENLLAIELDKRLFDFLRNEYPNLNIINDDVLRFDFNKGIDNKWEDVKVIANLPYSISSKIILNLLGIKKISVINILVQKEMAQRLLSNVSTKDYNAFTVLIQTFADVKHRLSVSRKEFVPMPEVESWFITLQKKAININFEDYSLFLKRCFHSRRKKMFNNLINFYEKKIIENIYNYFKIDSNVRAEEIKYEKFVEIFQYMEMINGSHNCKS